jgi:hypothetical protein
MIVYELITNSARYAFQGTEGKLLVELHSARNFVECRVSDAAQAFDRCAGRRLPRMAEPVVCAQAIMTPENCVAETERLIAAALYHRRPVYKRLPASSRGNTPSPLLASGYVTFINRALSVGASQHSHLRPKLLQCGFGDLNGITQPALQNRHYLCCDHFRYRVVPIHQPKFLQREIERSIESFDFRSR